MNDAAETLKQAAMAFIHFDLNKGQTLLLQVRQTPNLSAMDLAAASLRVMDEIMGMVDSTQLDRLAFGLSVPVKTLASSLRNDWHTYWSGNIEYVTQLSNHVASFCLTHASLLASPLMNFIMKGSDGLAALWALSHKLRCGHQTGDSLDRALGELWSDCQRLLLLDGSLQGDAALRQLDDDPTGVLSVSRALVMRAAEEFGLDGGVKDARGLTLSAHEITRKRYSQTVLPLLFELSISIIAESIYSKQVPERDLSAPVDLLNAAAHQKNRHGSHPGLMSLLRLVNAILSCRDSSLLQDSQMEHSERHAPGAFASSFMCEPEFTRILFQNSVTLPQRTQQEHSAASQSGGSVLTDVTSLLVLQNTFSMFHGSTVSGGAAASIVPLGQRSSRIVGTASFVNEGRQLVLEILVTLSGNAGLGWEDPTHRAMWAGACCTTLLEVAREITTTAPSIPQSSEAWDAWEAAENALRTCCQGFERLVSRTAGEGLFTHPHLHTVLLIPLEQLTTAMISQASNISSTVAERNASLARDDEEAFGDDEGSCEEAEGEQIISECVDLLLSTWVELTRGGLDDVTIRASIEGTEVATHLARGCTAVCHAYLQARIALHLSDARSLFKDTGRPQTEAGLVSSPGSGGGRGVDASSIVRDHGVDFALAHIRMIGLLSRHDPLATATFLSSKIKDFVDPLMAIITSQQQQSSSNVIPIKVSEALWCLFHVAGNFLADDDQEDRASIPTSMINFAHQKELQYPEDLATQEAANETLQLVSNLSSLADALANIFLSGNAAAICVMSPAVVEAFLTCLRLFTSSYLCPDEDLYMDFSPVFAAAFQRGYAIAPTIAKVSYGALCAFTADSDVTKAALSLLGALVKHVDMGAWFSSQTSMFDAFQDLALGDTRGLKSSDRGKLVGVLLNACTRELNTNRSTVDRMTQQLVARFQSILSSAQSDQVRQTSAATDVVEATRALFQTIVYPDLVVQVVNSVLPLIATIFASVDQRIAVGVSTITRTFLGSVLDLLDSFVTTVGSSLPASIYVQFLQHFAANTTSIIAAMGQSATEASHLAESARSQEEDERVEILTKIATVLKSLSSLSLCCVNAADTREAEEQRDSAASTTSVNAMVLLLSHFGTEQTQSLLAIPSLASAVFGALKTVAEDHTDGFLKSEHCPTLLSATQFAIEATDPQLNIHAYGVIEAIAGLCASHSYAGQRDSLVASLIQPFINCVLNAVITANVDLSAAGALSNALFALIQVVGAEHAHGSAVTALQQQYPDENLQPLRSAILGALLQVLQSTDFTSGARSTKIGFSSSIASVMGTVKGLRLA